MILDFFAMERADGDIEIEPLLSEQFVAILQKQHPLAGRKSLWPADLREEPFVFYARKMGPSPPTNDRLLRSGWVSA